MSWSTVGLVASAVLLAGCQSTAATSSPAGSSSTRASSTAPSARAATGGETRAYVTATVDGDTFRADVDGQSRKVRILGVVH